MYLLVHTVWNLGKFHVGCLAARQLNALEHLKLAARRHGINPAGPHTV